MKKPTVSKSITYAKAGGPPKNWPAFEVVEGNDARPMAEVIEVDTKIGWCVRYKRGDDGRLLVVNGALVEERVEGKFEIRVRK